MQNVKCPTCGRETGPDAASGCDHAAGNGAAKPRWIKPPPPPEVASWVITPTPPEELERLRQEFNEEEWLAALREIEQTGGVQIDDLIADLERRVNGNA